MVAHGDREERGDAERDGAEHDGGGAPVVAADDEAEDDDEARMGRAPDGDPATVDDGARGAAEKPDAGPAHAEGDGDADHDERHDG